MARTRGVLSRWALTSTIALLAMPVIALADGETDWFSTGGGTYTYAGGSASLIGNNIGISSVFGNGTPTNGGSTLKITNGLLNFTSGAYAGNGYNWIWDSTPANKGTLNLTGCIAGVTGTGAGKSCTSSDSNTVLLSDDFEFVQITPVSDHVEVIFGGIDGNLNAQLLSYFGLTNPSLATASFGGILASGLSLTPGGPIYSAINLGGTLTAQVDTTVPETWSLTESLGFFALALGGLFGMVRLKVLHLPARK